ncbi:MAG: CHASE3 domain-containing protein [Kofleriaceae bacterium]
MLIAFALLGAVGVASHAMTKSQVENTRWVEHTHTVMATIAMLSEHVADARRSVLAYLLTGDRAELVPYEEATRESGAAVHELRGLTRDNARQQERLDRLEPLADAMLAHLASASMARDAHSVDAARTLALTR